MLGRRRLGLLVRGALALLLISSEGVVQRAWGQVTECSATAAQQAAYRIQNPSATSVDGLGLTLFGEAYELTGTIFARCAPG